MSLESFSPAYLRQLELLTIHNRRAFLGSRQGGHVSPKRGHGIEFSDYRQYQLGDNPRHIDWGVYARSERLYVKRFQEDQDLSVLIIIDTSASMNVPESEGKWARTKEIALSLAYIALIQLDSVTIAPLGQRPSPRFRGVRSFPQMIAFLESVNLRKNFELHAEVQRALSAIRFPGVALFLSDFLLPITELRSAFTLLRSKNFDLSMIQILNPSDVEPLSSQNSATVEDSETGEIVDLIMTPDAREEYQFRLDQHITSLQTLCSEGGILFAATNSSRALKDSMFQDLAQVGLLR